MSNIYLWDLKRGDTFVFEDDSETQLLFIGMDGAFARVQALDPVKNKEMCERYDAEGNFFAIMSASPVQKVIPEGFEIEHIIDAVNERQSTVIIPLEGGN